MNHGARSPDRGPAGREVLPAVAADVVRCGVTSVSSPSVTVAVM